MLLFRLQFSSESRRPAITCICLYAATAALYSTATTGDVPANVPPGAQWQRTSGICSYAQQKRLHTKRWRTQTDANTKRVSSFNSSFRACLIYFDYVLPPNFHVSCWSLSFFFLLSRKAYVLSRTIINMSGFFPSSSSSRFANGLAMGAFLSI